MRASVPTSAVLSHWHKLIEGLETSSLDFYASLEQAIDKRAIPDRTTSRTDWQEGGFFSAKREYLRVARGRYTFDICAAPFGNGFFVSTWLGEPRPSPFLPTAAAIVAFSALWSQMRFAVGPVSGLFASLGLVVVALCVVGILLAESEKEAYIAVIPGVGVIFERLFRPLTYYRMDTALMFQEAVHSAVLEVIDGLIEAKGLRPLSELERKPVFREFYK